MLTQKPCQARFDGVTDPIVRYAPERMAWRGRKLDQSSLFYRVVPSLHHASLPPAQVRLPNGLVDVWADFLASGLVCPAAPTGIARHMQVALATRGAMQESSTWVQACFRASFVDGVYAWCEPRAGPVRPAAPALVLAVRERLVAHVLANPVLRREMGRRHFDWAGFERHTLEQCAAVRAGSEPAARRVKYFRACQESLEARAERLYKRARGCGDYETARGLHAGDCADKALLPHIGGELGKASIRSIPAPVHWPDHAELPPQNICLKCHSYKGALSYSRKEFRYTDGAHEMYGQRDVAYSLDSEDHLKCFKQRSNRKIHSVKVRCG